MELLFRFGDDEGWVLGLCDRGRELPVQSLLHSDLGLHCRKAHLTLRQDRVTDHDAEHASHHENKRDSPDEQLAPT